MEMKRHLDSVNDAKIKTVLQLKNDYNAGKISLTDAKRILKEKVGTLKPYEIALAEQELKEFDENECQKEDIQKMLELFEDIMDTSRPDLPDDHPIMCYYRENDTLKKILLEIEDLVQYPLIKNQWLELYDRLEQFRIHLSRKQNQLYSILEKKGFDRPTTTMWTLDNFIRDEIRDARKLLDDDADDQFIAVQSSIVADVRDLLQKEEAILYPTSLAMITEKEFEEMKSGDKEIGFAWINDSGTHSSTAKNNSTQTAHDTQTQGATGTASSLTDDLAAVLRKHGLNVGSETSSVFDVATGKLTLEQINLIYRHLPVDLSYVDENETVCFYSDTEHRVFPRSKNVIGRNVKNCHPRASVHIVEEIIEKFRSGEQDSAEFWINKPGIFIYILYTAVRDENGKFRGILEMMQDCTHIRSLTDSQTLLTWKKGGEINGQTVIQEQPAESGNGSTADTADMQGAENPHGKHGGKKLTAADITAETFLKDIFADYPALKDQMEEISPKFKMLKTPLARIMLPKATIAIASERTGVELNTLIEEIKRRIGK
ncbi:DUF438 domain-containing protein [Treponema vincentii]|uniref:DUF438 domain-containing protein n=1 Tax=Treponema vincentii TaxID=69710 RepID=UPI003D933208